MSKMIFPAPAGYEITLAEQSNLEAMVDLLGVLFSIEQDFHPAPEKQQRGLQLMLEDPQHCGLLVVKSVATNTVVGMITMQTVISTAQGTPSVWVEDLVVAAEYRKAGIGQALLAAAEVWAKTHGASRLQLLVDTDNTPAVAFYDRLRWESTHLQARRKLLS